MRIAGVCFYYIGRYFGFVEKILERKKKPLLLKWLIRFFFKNTRMFYLNIFVLTKRHPVSITIAPKTAPVPDHRKV